MSDTATAPATEAPAVTEVPSFNGADGKLNLALKAKDFPKSKEGRQAFFTFKARVCMHWADVFNKRAADIDRADDPAFQKQRKIDRLKEQLAKLEAETQS